MEDMVNGNQLTARGPYPVSWSFLWEFYGIYTGILKLDFNGDLMGCNGIWQDFMGFKGL